MEQKRLIRIDLFILFFMVQILEHQTYLIGGSKRIKRKDRFFLPATILQFEHYTELEKSENVLDD